MLLKCQYEQEQRMVSPMMSRSSGVTRHGATGIKLETLYSYLEKVRKHEIGVWVHVQGMAVRTLTLRRVSKCPPLFVGNALVY